MAFLSSFNRFALYYYWGEPERAPHKRDVNARSVYIMVRLRPSVACPGFGGGGVLTTVLVIDARA